MIVWQKSGAGRYYTRVRSVAGRTRTLSTGTDQAKIALATARWARDLRERHDPGRLLDAILDGELTLAEAHQLGEPGALAELARRRAAAADVDTGLYLDGWRRWLEARGRSAAVIATYGRQVATVWEARPWPRSAWTAPEVARRLDALPHAGPTKNRYRAALSSFARYLVRAGVLAANPVRDAGSYDSGRPRVVWYTMEDARRVIEALPPEAAAYEALMLGAGLSTQEVQRLRVRDVDLAAREVRAHGSKTLWRNRTTRILDHFAWTVPVIRAGLVGKLPGALLFPGYNRSTAGRLHRATVAALHLEPSTLHDWRHTHAVLSLQAGEALHVVAHQLGHGSTVLTARVYGRFVPGAKDYRTFTEGATDRATDDGRGRSGAVGHSGGRPL